jgi:hypothetical protein
MDAFDMFDLVADNAGVALIEQSKTYASGELRLQWSRWSYVVRLLSAPEDR